MIKQQPSTIKTQGKMLQHDLSLSFHIFCHMLLISTATAADYIYVECSGAYFTRLTPYETNVNSLFSSLVNSASVTNFNKFEISETNVVYGLYQCRGDLESSKCKDCVASSVNQLKTACPLSVGGSIQLDGCFLKYDNNPFFGVQSTVEVKKRCGPSIGYNTDILYNRDDALVNLIADNGKYFHGGDYGSIRGVAQCVQDLSLSDCQGCLSEASGRLRSQCETSSWGDMFLEKCYIRYDDQDIGHSSNNNSKDDGGGNNSKLMKIIASVIGVILAILGAASLTIIIKCCTTNRVTSVNSPTSVKIIDSRVILAGAASVTSSIKNLLNGTTRERERPRGERERPREERERPREERERPRGERERPREERERPRGERERPRGERARPAGPAPALQNVNQAIIVKREETPREATPRAEKVKQPQKNKK